MLIVDGASTDDTLKIIKQNENKLAFWMSEPDKGIYDAWNKLISHAKGDWLYFIGSDDWFYDRNVLEVAAPHLARAYPQYKVVYGSIANVTEKGEIVEIIGKPWEKVSKRFQHEMTIPHQGVFHHRTLFQTKGLFDPSFKICGDYELLLRELKTSPALFIPDLVLTAMQFGGVSATLSHVPLIIEELERARKQNNLDFFSFPLFARKVRAKMRRRIQSILGNKMANLIADAYRVLSGKPRIWTRK